MKIKKAASLPTNSLTQVKDNNNSRYRKSAAVKDLEQLANRAAREKYPNIPPQDLARRTFADDRANGLTKCIIAFLRLSGHQAERISTTGRPLNRTLSYTDVMGIRRTIGCYEWIKGTGTNGSADISATIRGRSVKIEVKINDRQSAAQLRYQESVEKALGLYTIARDFSSFVDWYNENFGGNE